ncbi:TorD/DmsD family molecular chaperone [Slackia heliotrinireducens]|uniref:TorD/DmsD family molecular chaperone n=1 Tax=Slackia heliotrinireducens TaxID=84110 RepID=UPI0033151732
MNTELLSAEALLLARNHLYTAFNKAMGGDPTPELVQSLVSQETIDALEEFAETSAKVAELHDLLISIRERMVDEEGMHQLMDQLQSEFTRLYVGPEKLPAQPFETPYAMREFTLFSRNTLAVRAAFHAQGYAAVRELHVPDDHIGTMCDFMARMGSRALVALREGDVREFRTLVVDQASFAATHMANWLPEMAAGQVKIDNAVLYPQMTAALDELVRADVPLLVELSTWAAERAGELAAKPQVERPESFARMDTATENLRAIRLFGLQDCELTTI